MMGTEMVPETSVSTCNQLTRLIAREDFIEFSCRESFKLYNNLIYLLTGGRLIFRDKDGRGIRQFLRFISEVRERVT
jgi:hypothetical protein